MYRSTFQSHKKKRPFLALPAGASKLYLLWIWLFARKASLAFQFYNSLWKINLEGRVWQNAIRKPGQFHSKSNRLDLLGLTLHLLDCGRLILNAPVITKITCIMFLRKIINHRACTLSPCCLSATSSLLLRTNITIRDGPHPADCGPSSAVSPPVDALVSRTIQLSAALPRSLQFIWTSKSDGPIESLPREFFLRIFI
jgi:hypothetical protein